MDSADWQLAVDTGGTFTDCIALDPRGRTLRVKVLSSSALRGALKEKLGPRLLRIEGAWSVPEDFFRGFDLRVLGVQGAWKVTHSRVGGSEIELEDLLPAELAGPGLAIELGSDEEAPILAARLVTGTPRDASLPPMELRLATTRGTNALLERHGAKTLLLITKGFGDLLAIGTQQRADLFALEVRKAEPLAAGILEVDERLAADGSVIRELDREGLERSLDELSSGAFEAAAVAFMHGYRNPAHEMCVGQLLKDRGWGHVSLSSELAPLIKILPRTETTVVDAYLSPVVGDYLERVGRAVSDSGRGRVLAMTSAGGLVGAEEFRPKDSLLSGPAGGVIGAAQVASRSGFDRIIAFDMGGTSTDVARYGGELEHRFEIEVAGVHLLAPALAIDSVAAGGGSICRFDGQRLTVGPESAGASPGPACYGAGGPMTITDANLLLGRLDVTQFEIPLDFAGSKRAMAELLAELEGPAEGYLAGLVRIADERMAEAIRRISVRRGYRPSDHALVAFGGAGGQHACAVAELLAMQHVVIPVDAGLLSAAGVSWASLERIAQRQMLCRIDTLTGDRLEEELDRLFSEACEALAKDGVSRPEVAVAARRADMRIQGQASSLAIEVDPVYTLEERFLDRYEETFGYRPHGAVVEIEALRVIAKEMRSGGGHRPEGQTERVIEERSQRCFLGSAWLEIPLLERQHLDCGARFSGPALVTERHSATLVGVGWSGTVDRSGALILSRDDGEEPGTPLRGVASKGVDLGDA